MHIGIVTSHHISQTTGGNEQHAHHLARGLVKLGHQVTYFSADDARDSKYTYRKLKTLNLYGHIFPIPILTSLPATQFDIIHCLGSGLALHYAAKFSNKTCPKIITIQADSQTNSILSRVFSSIEKQMIESTYEGILTTTPYYKDKLSKKFSGINIAWAPLMISKHLETTSKLSKHQARKLTNTSGKYTILFVGSLSRHHYYKDLEFLLKAMSKLPDSYNLVIVGDGDKLQEYKNLALRLKIEHKVSFVGHIPNETLPNYFAAAVVFVLPSSSDTEGFGLVVIEAMRQKVPTITTNAIGPAEWYAKKRVTLQIDPRNIQQLSAAMVKSCTNKDTTMIQRAYDFSLRFSVDAMTHKTVQFYKQIRKSV